VTIWATNLARRKWALARKGSIVQASARRFAICLARKFSPLYGRPCERR
jgi:hypothetical protein